MNPQILIVDDQADIQQLAVTIVKAMFPTAIIHSAREVRLVEGLLKEMTFNMVLTDYDLPDGTGADIARAIRNQPDNDTVIFCMTSDPKMIDDKYLRRYSIRFGTRARA